MVEVRTVCPQCGARQKEAGGVCELCGSLLHDEQEDVRDERSEGVGTDPVQEGLELGEESADDVLESLVDYVPVAATISSVGGFCTSCGTPFPEGARFCGSCGRRLVTATSEPAAKEVSTHKTPPEEVEAGGNADGLGRQVFLVIGAALLLVVGLFFVTVASKRSNGGAVNSSGMTELNFTPAPLSPEAEAQVETLRQEIDASSGPARTVAQTRLVDFLVSEGRFDLAGDAQEALAAESNAEVDWIRAGNLFYDWMERVGGEERVAYAKKAISTYNKALEINPDNLDVRTDLAIAYLNDPQNQMEAIANTNRVLEADSNHVQANFNKGIMLLRIGRYDGAERQFERVKALVGDSGNPIYQRAESALEAVDQLRAN